MKRTIAAALLQFCSFKSITAQQVGTYIQEENPTITLKECTVAGGCTSRQAKLTLDANWRWIHSTTGSTNCYTGNAWNSQYCSDPVECAKQCALEGVSLDKYRSTYGIQQVQDGVKMQFVTDHQHGVNVGSRLYVMDEGGNDDKYQLFYLKNREFSFEVDLSELQCGMNGAMYFTEMAADGGKGNGNNAAGAKYGTGYCDAQCPHDMKFIDGEANVIDWKPNPKDESENMGMGKYGSCCAEMDIWEANSMATAYTPHTCGEPGQFRCEGIECGDNDKGERYDGVCDKDGCDINPYRMGNESFYGRGPEFTVDTTKPMTVVTQFLTTDGTDDGDLSEIRRFYVQDGNIIDSPSSTILGDDNSDSITDAFCDAKKDLFGDVKDYQEHGGMKGMGESLDRGHVMIFSLWDDVEVNMMWLDLAFPLNKPVTNPGIKRGECVGGDESTPTYLCETYPDAYVTFKNAAVGEIGSTTGPVTPTTSSPTTPNVPTESPVVPPTSNQGYCNWNGCDGTVQGGDWCNQTRDNCEGNCGGTWCTNNPPAPAPSPQPPTSQPPTPPTGLLPATTTRYWDCSGGSCGCAYLSEHDAGTPTHCNSNAMFQAPTNNPYGAKFYGTAAVSNVLFQDTNNNGWLGEGCGKCYKVTGSTSNISGYSGVETTLVLKAANYCPPENPACSGNKAHFDIAAPGFDVTRYSFAHVCPERDPEEAEGFAAYGSWMIDEQDPNVNCDCSKFKSPVLRAGCENFLSLKWNNSPVEYEEVLCPFELDRLNCWEENGGGYPFDIPEFCASNIDSETTSTSSPTASSTSSPTAQPTPCADAPTDMFFLRMKTAVDPEEPVYKSCEWLASSTDTKKTTICTKKTDSYGGYGPAREVCKAACGTCDLTDEPTSSPTMPPTNAPTKASSSSPSTEPTIHPTQATDEPTSSPTAQPTPCADAPTDMFFLRMKTTVVPEEPVYKSCEWLASSTDTKKTNVCTKKTDSYGGYGPAREVCKAACGTCDLTDEPTSSPTKQATTSPTGSPTKTPTVSPTKTSTHSGPCCSFDFRTCPDDTSTWCHQSAANCQQCGGIIITDAPLQCIARWGDCTNDVNGCCSPASCQGNDGYRQCLS